MKWRRLRTLLVREVRATLRDPFTMLCLVAVPVMALLAFSSVLATDVKHLALGVYDASASPASRRLVAELGASAAFDPVPFVTRGRLEEALVAGDVSVGVVIPPDFERQLLDRAPGEPAPEVQILLDGAETVVAGNADTFVRAIVASTGGELVSGQGWGPRARGASGGVRTVTRALFNQRLDGVPFMVAGTFGFVLSFLTTLITAVSVVNERITGTFDQLQLTPATSAEILLGKLLPLGAVFALDVVLMMLVAGLLFGVWPKGNVFFFLLVSSYYVVTSLAMGLIFSATSETAAEAVQKTVLFSIPLFQLSGFAFPLRSMPKLVQWFSEAVPATHYIRICRGVYLRGESPFAMTYDLLMIVVFGVALVGLTAWSLGRRT